ncbi:MAG: phasin family protein [Magnetococcales bacterium]|nr:phasin family protein [Magnetococcales bacterium]MBF0156582.1 phasin family protein [Magnetococcales bacterium]
MDTKVTKQMTEMAQSMIDSMTAYHKIANGALQSLARQQLAVIDGIASIGTRQMEALKDVKDVKDALAVQADAAAKLNEMMVNSAKASLDEFKARQEELAGLLDKGVKDMLKQAESLKR